MVYTDPGFSPAMFDQCRYDGSRLLMRGPRRDLDGEFVACLGGTETFGRFILRPYPDLLEDRLGVTCVNFGWPNAGIDVFSQDHALLDCASRSRLCILQVPSALNMSNMYYRVHPRRNDRFLDATDALRALFPDVDFTEFSFVRHMLSHLFTCWPDKFAYLGKELSALWLLGMTDLIQRIRAPVVLLWLSRRRPEDAVDQPSLDADPALVSREMLEDLRQLVLDVVEVRLLFSTQGMEPNTAERCQLSQNATQAAFLDPQSHQQTAKALQTALCKILD